MRRIAAAQQRRWQRKRHLTPHGEAIMETNPKAIYQQNIMNSPIGFAQECVELNLSIANVLDQLDDKPGCNGQWRETVVRWMIHYQHQS